MQCCGLLQALWGHTGEEMKGECHDGGKALDCYTKKYVTDKAERF